MVFSVRADCSRLRSGHHLSHPPSHTSPPHRLQEEELKRIRRILCINQETTDAAMKETAGLLLSELLSDIYMMGAKPVGEYEVRHGRGWAGLWPGMERGWDGLVLAGACCMGWDDQTRACRLQVQPTVCSWHLAQERSLGTMPCAQDTPGNASPHLHLDSTQILTLPPAPPPFSPNRARRWPSW